MFACFPRKRQVAAGTRQTWSKPLELYQINERLNPCDLVAILVPGPSTIEKKKFYMVFETKDLIFKMKNVVVLERLEDIQPVSINASNFW